MKISEYKDYDLRELRQECLENLDCSPLVISILEEVNKEIRNRMMPYM